MADADIRTLEADDAGMNQTVKDLGSGAAGGIAQVLLGELSHLQTSSQASIQPHTHAVHKRLVQLPILHYKLTTFYHITNTSRSTIR